jgi:hypothetical protein
MFNSAVRSVQDSDHFKVADIQEHVIPQYDLTMLNSAVRSVQHSDHFKVADIQEHVIPQYDLTMLNSAVICPHELLIFLQK